MNRLALSLTAALLAGAALTGCCSTSSAPLCDTDASCAALGGAPGYGVTAEKVAEYGPTLVATPMPATSPSARRAPSEHDTPGMSATRGYHQRKLRTQPKENR